VQGCSVRLAFSTSLKARLCAAMLLGLTGGYSRVQAHAYCK
jgi:hypothetical protein